MGDLTASLAHELSQPLTAIRSNANAGLRFMRHEPVGPDGLRDLLADIVEANSRAVEVIRRIRDFVKKEDALEFDTVDLATVVREVVALSHSDAILRDIRVRVEVDGGLPPVRGDRVQLQQVLLNILLNAFEAAANVRPRSVRSGSARTMSMA